MEITINGKTEDMEARTLADLVRMRAVDPSGLVIEHNLRIVRQAHWAVTPLAEGDTVELLSFVGGG
jgi:thiamine biosynthesis protein ThiS